MWHLKARLPEQRALIDEWFDTEAEAVDFLQRAIAPAPRTTGLGQKLPACGRHLVPARRIWWDTASGQVVQDRKCVGNYSVVRWPAKPSGGAS